VFAILLLSVLAFAQEGHPMTGTWYGDWGPAATQRNELTVVMAWDGKNITGTINPGPDSIPIKIASLDSAKWMFHLEADTKDKSGAAVHIVADGKLDDIGSYHRTLSGTWTQGTAKGNFKITRD
jgi:hypothetical protein